MILGNQVEWALHCVMILASVPEGKRLNSRALAEFHGVPKEYLSKCLQMLSHAGLVHTTPGPYGGYLAFIFRCRRSRRRKSEDVQMQ
jgi:DNA-binding IscR family transcriptional regulator